MDIGNKIRELRNTHGLTLEELAIRCELSKGFLSQLERGLTSVSIDALDNILEVLDTNLSDFFKEDKKQPIIYKKEDYYINQKDGATIEWIVPNAQGKEMEPLRLTLEPGSTSQTIHPHDGEELGYVLEGCAELVIGGKSYKVHKGETFYIQGTHSHFIKNNNKSKCVLLWIMTPPNF